MNAVKSLWDMVRGDPVFMRRVNGWLAIFWVIMIPVSIATGWVNSVVYVSALSLWALVSGHWSAWQAARVEVKQQDDAKKKDEEDVPAEVVDALVERTDVSLADSDDSGSRTSPTNSTRPNDLKGVREL